MQATSKAVLKLWFQYVPVINSLFCWMHLLWLYHLFSAVQPTTQPPTVPVKFPVALQSREAELLLRALQGGFLIFILFIHVRWPYHIDWSIYNPFIHCLIRHVFLCFFDIHLLLHVEHCGCRSIQPDAWKIRSLQLDSSHKPSFPVWRHGDVVLFTLW